MSILCWFNDTVVRHKGSRDQLEKLLHPFLGLCLFFYCLVDQLSSQESIWGWKQLPGAVIYFLMHSTSRSWLTLAMRQHQDGLCGSREIVLNSVPFTDTLCTQNICRTASVQFSVNSNLICPTPILFLVHILDLNFVIKRFSREGYWILLFLRQKKRSGFFKHVPVENIL